MLPNKARVRPDLCDPNQGIPISSVYLDKLGFAADTADMQPIRMQAYATDLPLLIAKMGEKFPSYLVVQQFVEKKKGDPEAPSWAFLCFIMMARFFFCEAAHFMGGYS